MVVAYMPAMAITAFATGEFSDKSAKPTANTLVYDGSLQNLVTPIEGFEYTYTLDSVACTGIPQAKDADTYTVGYVAKVAEGVTGLTGTDLTGTVTVTIQQADPVKYKPAIIPTQQYTGKAIDLITKGEVYNGTMTYSIGNASTLWGWSDTAQAIEIGSYNVYYKVTPTDTKNYKTIDATWIGTAKIVGPVKVTLKYTSYAYNGEYKTPEIVSVVGYDGLQIPSTAYQVTGETSAIMPGTHKFTVTGTTADYKWSTDCNWRITVKKTSIKSLKKGSKSFTVKVKELDEEQVTGYQVRYATKSSMSGAKIKKIGSDSETVKKTIKSLKKGKKYYVQARSYVTVNGVKYYSDWSAKKTVKTK